MKAAPLSFPPCCISPAHDVRGYAELCGRPQTQQADFDAEADLSISLKHSKCQVTIAEA